MAEYTLYEEYGYYSDGLRTIPNDPDNPQYQEMMQEVAGGVSNIVTVSAVVLTLDDFKTEKKLEIDRKTDQLIEAGITHNSVEFKINLEKEITALGLNSARMAGADMAGKKFRAKDQTYTFVDTADFDAWFNTAFARVESLLVSGSELKDQVDAAADQAALDAIVDNRV